MMLGWSFAARTVEEVARLVRVLGKHRYVREVDHRIHFTVDIALTDIASFGQHARDFEERCKREPDLDPASREPSLWRPATADDIAAVFAAFWTPGSDADRYRDRLLTALEATGLAPATHEPFAGSPDDPPHPDLVRLDWVLLPVDELDTERHAGALGAMEDSGEEVNPSEPIFQEGPTIAAPELCDGAPNGVLPEDFLIWSDGPYPYVDYVFRGASKAAKLVDPPQGYRDF